MKKISLFLLAPLFLGLSSLAPKSVQDFTPGTYGVCDCEGTDSTKSSIIELNFKADNTFHYIDNSVPSNKLDITGNWENKDGIIELKNYGSRRIHHTWKTDGDKCIRSRSQLNWRRLCSIKGCGG